ncbi:hypothetical protein KC19_VG143800 [Ceratodon purpureus]|uniref:Uncharacterized protein n=1 Tax=Ceratodon purpureus TaxID=3225 RepID=A0A8T0HR58_CERPU|nr:hypothetical protein KC19_VG143800 [Ceratodon purpureus]
MLKFFVMTHPARHRSHGRRRRRRSYLRSSSSPDREYRKRRRSPTVRPSSRRYSQGSRASAGRHYSDSDSDPEQSARRLQQRHRRDWEIFPSSARSPSPRTPPLSAFLPSPPYLSPASIPTVHQVKNEGCASAGIRCPDALTKRSNQLISRLLLNPESVMRRERRAREHEREKLAAVRESNGKIKHFVHVNEEGRPYGLGVTEWNDALA